VRDFVAVGGGVCVVVVVVHVVEVGCPGDGKFGILVAMKHSRRGPKVRG